MEPILQTPEKGGLQAAAFTRGEAWRQCAPCDLGTGRTPVSWESGGRRVSTVSDCVRPRHLLHMFINKLIRSPSSRDH